MEQLREDFNQSCPLIEELRHAIHRDHGAGATFRGVDEEEEEEEEEEEDDDDDDDDDHY